ncbi:hypothetical protein BDZ91DRAFT_736276 [Kalaharituber pfeilii]|nr:hypothetical protein BDZ91DRAFT_736276 [Kalaharituber pfeilii]
MSPEYDYLSHFSDAGQPFHQHDVHTGPNSTRRFFVIPFTGENSISLQPRHNSVRKISSFHLLLKSSPSALPPTSGFRPSPTAFLTAHSTATSTFTHPLSSLPSYRLLQHPVQQQLRLSLLRDILQHLRRLSCGTSTIFLRPYSSPW